MDGRLIVVVSKKLDGEPRFQVSWGLETQQIFGVDVDGWKPGDTVEVRVNVMGAPVHTLADLQAGKYNVQAVLNVYETFLRAGGRGGASVLSHACQSPLRMLRWRHTIFISTHERFRAGGGIPADLPNPPQY